MRWIVSKAEAQQRIDRAFQLLGQAHIYPADKIEPMSDAYHALQAQADHYSETGQTQKAIDTYQQLLGKLSAWGPKPDEDLRDATCISRTWTALADLLRRAGRNDEALRFEAQRTELWNQWKNKLPNAQFLLRQSLSQVASRAASRPAATQQSQVSLPTQRRQPPASLAGKLTQINSCAVVSPFACRFRFPKQRVTLSGFDPDPRNLFEPRREVRRQRKPLSQDRFGFPSLD